MDAIEAAGIEAVGIEGITVPPEDELLLLSGDLKYSVYSETFVVI